MIYNNLLKAKHDRVLYFLDLWYERREVGWHKSDVIHFDFVLLSIHFDFVIFVENVASRTVVLDKSQKLITT